MKLSLVLIGKSGEIENLEILFFSKRLESQTQFELLLEENLKMTEPLRVSFVTFLLEDEREKRGDLHIMTNLL